MFATTDSPSRRHLHAVALRPGLREAIEVPEFLDREARRAVGLPTVHRLRVLARALEGFVRESDAPDAGPLEAIEIRVYRVHFTRETLIPVGEPLASLRVPTRGE